MLPLMVMFADTLKLFDAKRRRALATRRHLALTARLSKLNDRAIKADLAKKYRRAARLRKRCVSIEMRLDRPEQLAQQHYEYGLALRAIGRSTAAVKALTKAVELGRAHGAPLLAADAQLAIAGVMLLAKNVESARSAALAADLFYRRLTPGADGPTPAARLLGALAAMQKTEDKIVG